MNELRVALITGVGPGLGASLARRFAHGGYAVGLVARRADYITQLANDISSGGGKALAIAGDVGQPEDVKRAVARVHEDFGKVTALLHNASAANRAGLLGTTAEEFESAWRVSSLGGFLCARETASDMIAVGEGVMLFTGATSSVRGGAWLAFSSAKFGLRGLAQSLALDLWPKGVHVAHVLVDGWIGDAGAPFSPDDPRIDPDQMAEAYWHLANQNRSAWTFELDLRSNTEAFFD